MAQCGAQSAWQASCNRQGWKRTVVFPAAGSPAGKWLVWRSLKERMVHLRPWPVRGRGLMEPFSLGWRAKQLFPNALLFLRGVLPEEPQSKRPHLRNLRCGSSGAHVPGRGPSGRLRGPLGAGCARSPITGGSSGHARAGPEGAGGAGGQALRASPPQATAAGGPWVQAGRGRHWPPLLAWPVLRLPVPHPLRSPWDGAGAPGPRGLVIGGSEGWDRSPAWWHLSRGRRTLPGDVVEGAKGSAKAVRPCAQRVSSWEGRLQ